MVAGLSYTGKRTEVDRGRGLGGSIVEAWTKERDSGRRTTYAAVHHCFITSP
jgi:hypothetical protein